MELINKNHIRILGFNTGSSFISFQKSGKISFSKKAIEEFGISEGLFVHFVRSDKQWYIFFNNNDSGFKINERNDKKNRAVIFNSTKMYQLFINETKTKAPCRFYLQLSAEKYQKEKLIEILVGKSIEKMGQ